MIEKYSSEFIKESGLSFSRISFFFIEELDTFTVAVPKSLRILAFG